MQKNLHGIKVAVLVASGFEEACYISIQRRMQACSVPLTLVSVDAGVVNGCGDKEWGLNYLADCQLSSALAADFDMLIVPGGFRCAEKLKATAHTRRFLGGFIDAGKPVVLFNEAIDLLAFAERSEGRDVAQEQGVCVDGALMTVRGAVGDEMNAAADQAVAFLLAEQQQQQLKQAA